ncbi:aminopeptidase P N-terminal domain-containing protein [Tenacibaculum sp. UWU-22]|uniref:aminopeptidase P N-terminal domain-containing protein n=1 Tax=Tenacibaculum sp. UWU-22 TaxID=3234187 RepID=UPI0034DAFC93
MVFLRYILVSVLLVCSEIYSQQATDFLSKDFHRERRNILRAKMPKNSVAVIFANPIRNRSNDVDYVFHQDPNFYYLTGYREPNAVLVLYADMQTSANGNTFNEVLYVQRRDKEREMWNGKRLGVEGAKKELGFTTVKTTEEFETDHIDFKKFDKIFVEKFNDDYRNSISDKAETYDLVESFKKQSGYNLAIFKPTSNNPYEKEYNPKVDLGLSKKIDVGFLPYELAGMREIKTPEELKLLTKAIRISAIGQIETMKAMQPGMSETEIQGIHEFVYKKYGAEFEGYPSIVGSGNNGCILHYIENDKPTVGNNLVLMDVGAEYHGYTADVTRTIPANGKFNAQQKAIYNLVLKAQKAGIEACRAGNLFWATKLVTKKIINQGLFDLGIIKSIDQKHKYFPHGTSHHIGLDVHDLSNYGALQPNMVITVEPGVYIPKGSNCDKKWWGIGVRIEDDVLITNSAPKVLSEEAPKTVEAIEKMMAKKSVLDDFILPDLD